MREELLVMLMAALPVTELRAAIPLAMTTFGLPAGSALVFAVVGNLLPIPVLYWLLPPFVKWAKINSPAVDRLVERYFHYLKHKHGTKFEKASAIALAAFVAIPLPGTGVWTGTVLAILFGIRSGFAVPSIVAGAMAAGVIVTLVTTGTLGAWRFLI
jgi:uncharacterized membrane protein